MDAVTPFRHRSFPLSIHAGKDALEQLRGEVERTKSKRALIVCGKSVARKTDLVGRITANLEGKLAGVFDGVEESSPLPSVLRGAAAPVSIPLSAEAAVLRKRSAGAVSSASSSQIMAAGRVFGSNNSSRWRVAVSITAVPARVIAVLGVVRTRMFGILGAISLGLTGAPPGGY